MALQVWLTGKYNSDYVAKKPIISLPANTVGQWRERLIAYSAPCSFHVRRDTTGTEKEQF